MSPRPPASAPSRPLRITYLHQYFRTPDMGGGGATRSFELGRRLVAAGHRVRLITADTAVRAGQRGWRVSDEAGIEVHWAAVPYSNYMSVRDRLAAFVRFAAASTRRARRLRSDVVFATSTPLTIAVPGMLAARRHGVPFVFEVRDLWPEVPVALGVLRNPVARWLAWRLARLAYGRADHIVALSPDMRDGILRHGVDPERISVIPNLSDLARFGEATRPGEVRGAHDWLGDRPLVLYAGTLGRVNHVDYLVGLARELLAIDDHVRIAILGDGAERPGLARRAAEAGVLGRNLFLLDPVPKSRIADWFAAADVCASTVANVRALWANSANKVFDALAAGRPLMINHEGWQADMIRTERIGLVLGPDPSPEAARELAERLRDRTWLREAGDRARALARREFSADLLAARLERLLLQVVEDRQSAVRGTAGTRPERTHAG